MDDDRHQLSMTILMTPHMSNSAGDVHGGGRRRRCVETGPLSGASSCATPLRGLPRKSGLLLQGA